MSLTKIVCGDNFTTNLIKDNINELIDESVLVRGDITTLQSDVVTLEGDSTSLRTDVDSLKENTALYNGIKTLPQIEGTVLNVKGFYADTSVGGGKFYYDPLKDKTEHNGGTVIAPEALVAWDGTQGDLATLLDWSGTGSGCFVKDIDRLPSYYDFGAKGDDLSDDVISIQHCLDLGGKFRNIGGKFRISKSLEIRNNTSHGIFGESGASPSDHSIGTLDGFVGWYILKQWSDSWYASPEVPSSEPPANLSSYWQLVDRYINIDSLTLRVDHENSLGQRVSPLGIVSLQERSLIRNVVFNGTAGVVKGHPIYLDATPTGNEVSFNGTTFENMVCYSDNWQSQFVVKGSGSDVTINNYVTSPRSTLESPFQVNVIDFKINNLHIEAHAVGLPTFKIEAPDFRMTNSFVVIQDLQGDVFSCTNPDGVGGFGRAGVSVKNLKVYAVGGSQSNVTNRASINLLNDTSQVKSVIVPLLCVANNIPSQVFDLDRTHYSVADGNGNASRVVHGVPILKFIKPAGVSDGTVVTAGSSIVITDPLFIQSTNDSMINIDFTVGSATGAAGADYFNNPQIGRFILASSRNASETRRRCAIINDSGIEIFSAGTWDHVAGTITLTVAVSFTNLKMLATVSI